jgi:cation:H+ antiporter
MELIQFLYFVIGLCALIGGAELLVRGAGELAAKIGISPLVVGLTVVAFGTSSPELGVSITSAFTGQADIALGNVVGSNICNLLLILGLASLACPLPVCRQLLRKDLPIAIAASLVLWIMALDGTIGRLDGIILFAAILFYVVWTIRASRRQSKVLCAPSVPASMEPAPNTPARMHLVTDLLFMIIGLVLLGLGARLLVNAAVILAQMIGVSELVIGLTVVSIGTSLPEIATSVVAGLRGKSDIAVGNIIGSNLFNILAVLGFTAAIAPDGVRVAGRALAFDIPLMVAVTIACIPVFHTGNSVSRREGTFFLGLYIAYTFFLIYSKPIGTLPVL